VGEDGFAAQSDPTQFIRTPVSVGSTADLLAVYQPPAGQVWISGVDGGTNWVARPSGTTANLYAYLEGAAGWRFATAKAASYRRGPVDAPIARRG
jgi:hypothetical protein